MKARSFESLQELLKDYQRQQTALRRHITSLMWHMRGGITREEAWTLSPAEREDIAHLIEERWKFVEKTKLPIM